MNSKSSLEHLFPQDITETFEETYCELLPDASVNYVMTKAIYREIKNVST